MSTTTRMLQSTPQSQTRRPMTGNPLKDDSVKRPLSSITTPRAQSKAAGNSNLNSKLNKENGVNRITVSPPLNQLNKSPLNGAKPAVKTPISARSPLANHSVTKQSTTAATQPVKRTIALNKTNAVAGVRKPLSKPQSKPQTKSFAAHNASQEKIATLTSALQMEKEKNAALRAEIEFLRSELSKAKHNQIMSIEDDELLKDFWHPVAPWDYYDAVNSHGSSASSEAEQAGEAEVDQQQDAESDTSDDSMADDYDTADEHFADEGQSGDDEYSEDDLEQPQMPTRVAPTLATSNSVPVMQDDELAAIASQLSQLRMTPTRPQSDFIDIMSSPESAFQSHHLSVNPSLLSPVNVNINDDESSTESETDDNVSINVSQVEIQSESPLHESSYSQSRHLITPLTDRSQQLTQSPFSMQSEQQDEETDLSDVESVEDGDTESDISAQDQLKVESATEEEVEEEEDDGSSQGFVDVFPYERNLYLLSRHYHLHHRLYSCADAVTFKASHIQTGQLVVIKISEGYSHSGYLSGSRASHPKEIRLLNSAQGHSNIMEMVGWFGFPATRCYAFITHYVENVSVENLFDNPTLIRLYMRDLLTGIAHLHSRNILYRDLKPSNVLWNSMTQKATIIDFDVATYLNREGGHSAHVGTYGYMAPEMGGETRYTLAVDVYSAGIVFGSLLFGFHEDEVADRERHDTKGAAMIDRVLAFSQQFNGRIGADFHLLLRMLTEDPALRITIEEALQHPYITQERC